MAKRKDSNTSMSPAGLLEEVISKLSELDSIEKERYYDGRNILSILKDNDKEVIMCEVLASIVGYKNQGKYVFLDSFVRDVLNVDMDPKELSGARVLREFFIPRKSRRIDIVIKTAHKFIPVEAKIYADDQNGQCADYLSYAEEFYSEPSEARLYYLTLDGKDPSDKSVLGRKDLCERIKSIAWKSIYEWLMSIKDIDENEAELVGQFGKAIKTLMDIDRRKFDMTIEEMIDSPEGMKAAMEITDALNRKKNALMLDIFEEIKKKVSENPWFDFDPQINDKWDYKAAIEKYYYRDRVTSSHPAFNYNLGLIHKDTSGSEYYFIIRFEIDWLPFNGFAIIRKDSKGDLFIVDHPSKEMFEEVSGRLADPGIISKKKNDWWLYWEYIVSGNQDRTDEDPDFKQMNEAYFSLFTAEGRRTFVEEVVASLNKFKEYLKK